MSATVDQDFADRVREYADALTLGELYREPGEAIDELGEPLHQPQLSLSLCDCGWRKSRRDAMCIRCREPDRVAAMLSPEPSTEEAPQPRPLWRKEW